LLEKWDAPYQNSIKGLNGEKKILERWRVMTMAKSEFTARVAQVEVELGMSVQNKSGIWCKPTVRMNIMIDGGTDPKQREAIVKQAFDEVCNNIEKVISEME
jgi:hypothetical protein